MMQVKVPDEVLDACAAERVLVMTGAGMSAESGLATFRDEHTGLWSRFRPEELATPEAWWSDKALVWGWYQWRVSQVAAARPNAGHEALARWSGIADLTLVTQNVDDLHERAGSEVAWHLHGSLFEPRCDACEERSAVAPPPHAPIERIDPPVCPGCGGSVRPGVVWFGEMPHGIEDVMRRVREHDVVVVVGTSGAVYPAALVAPTAVECGIPVVEINPNPTDGDGFVSWGVTAAEGLPVLVDALAP